MHSEQEAKSSPKEEPHFPPFEDATCTEDEAEEAPPSNATAASATGGFTTYKPGDLSPSPEPSPAPDEDSDASVVARASAVASRKREMLADLKKVINQAKQAREGLTLDPTMATQLKEASALAKERGISLDEAAEQLIDEKQLDEKMMAASAGSSGSAKGGEAEEAEDGHDEAASDSS